MENGNRCLKYDKAPFYVIVNVVWFLRHWFCQKNNGHALHHSVNEWNHYGKPVNEYRLFGYSRCYGESITRHNWFEPISARRGLGNPAACLTSLGITEIIAIVARIDAIAKGSWHALPHLIAASQPKLLHLQQCGENTYSRCHKEACVQISIGNTQWLLR